MRQRLTLGWMLAVVLLIGQASPGSAQVKPEGVSFITADGVEIQGTFYPAKGGNNRPSVILLHSVFKDPNQGKWEPLAQFLATQETNGYNVLRFDFRGHGNSKVLAEKDRFWNNAINAKYMPTQAARKMAKIDYKDFSTKTGYYPMLANDILAARMFLDRKNDRSEASTSSVYLIGANETISIGMLYMAVEWTRPRSFKQGVTPIALPVVENRTLDVAGRDIIWPTGTQSAGTDIAGAIWLSPIRHTSISADLFKKFVRDTPEQKMREKNPMLFVYGEQDTSASAFAKYVFGEVLVAKGGTGKLSPLTLTFTKAIPKTKNAGVELLGTGSETDKAIIDYLNAIDKDRKNITTTNRFPPDTPPLINLAAYGVQN